MMKQPGDYPNHLEEWDALSKENGQDRDVRLRKQAWTDFETLVLVIG
jgi:hypothetical protein